MGWIAAVGLASAFLLIAAEGFLYLLRWYELSNRAYDPQRGWAQSLFSGKALPFRVFIKECFYSALYLLTYAIGGIINAARITKTSPDTSKIDKDAPLIILIHGYMAKPWHFWMMRLRFRLRGMRNVITFGYKNLGASVETYVDSLRDFMLKIRSETGVLEASLVGHSFGGVIALEYAKKYSDDGDIKTVVALAAPFRGSRLAALSVTSLGRSLHPSNPYFAQVLTEKIKAPFISIYSRYDQFVLPYTNSEHPCADKNVEITSCGHSGFYFDGKSFKIAMDWIELAAMTHETHVEDD